MQDYTITKCTRKCAQTGRNLEPGESYFSVILPSGEGVTRKDVAAAAWHGPEETAIGWWRSTMPVAQTAKLRPAPNGVLLDTLSELLERPGREPLAYFLALLLMRRRVLTKDDQSPAPPDGEESTHWNLVCPADGRQWLVPLVNSTPAEFTSLQEELKSLLFTEE